jgi:multiple sugar transport system permease protein
LLNARWFSTWLRNALRGLLILPWLFSFAAAALVWGLLYHPFGLLSYLITTLGISAHPVEFLASRQLALPSLILVNVWKTYPFYMVMILGGLQSIPEELYECATIDGATALQRFRCITLPLLRPILVAITALDFITTFGHYDLIKTLTEGGPFGSTRTVAYYIWMSGFRDGNLGYGAAASVVLLVFLSVAMLVYLKVFAQGEEIYGETTTGI